MSKNKREAAKKDDTVHICQNRRAFHEYEVFETLECGIVLTGTEVKSLRARAANLEDAYAKIKEGDRGQLRRTLSVRRKLAEEARRRDRPSSAA